MINIDALFSISYGLYIVSSGDQNKGNGFVSNTVFQVSSKPAKFAACCNKENYTAQLIQKHKAFSVSVLETNTSSDTFGTFGFKSGKEINKLEGKNIKYDFTGVPIILNDCVAYLECKVIETVDVGTHLMFIGELVNSDMVDNNKEPITYAHYRNVNKGSAPKNAPTYIDKTASNDSTNKSKKHECSACGFIYDEANEEKNFEDLPDNWTCPVCGAEKSDFMKI